MDKSGFIEAYAACLKSYIESREEQYLAAAADLGRAMLQADVPPEEIAEIHEKGVQDFALEFPDLKLSESMPGITATLIEMLMAYGLDFRERKSEHERLEEQLHRSQRMEAIGQLAGGVAHDFNNVLGIVMGNLQLLKRRMKDDPDGLGFLETALKGVWRGADITQKLLDFSGHRSSKPSTTDINALIVQMERLIKKSMTVSFSVETKLAHDLWLVEINAGDFEDVLLNLSLNARDAMPNGGTLLIETANLVLDKDYAARNPTFEAGDFVMISVRDTGLGMTELVKDKLFEPFFTTKEVGKGRGLGLSMVYGFVKRSHGLITVNSKSGAGTTFQIYLPRARGDMQKTEATNKHQAELPRGSETILIVDDEEILCDIAVNFLEELGYATLTAGNGQEALDALTKHPEIDLLFCDVIMPGNLDGYQVAKTAHELRPNLSILLTSGFRTLRGEHDDGESEYLSGLTRNLLRKPYNDEELAATVRRTLDGVGGRPLIHL